MKYSTLFTTAMVVSAFYVMSSCTDKLPEPVTDSCASAATIYYNDHIKPIIDAKCNLSGCHDNTSQIGFGDYASLNATRMDNIYDRVVVVQNMPPSGNLSSTEVDNFRCWKEGGFQEKDTSVGLDCSSVTITYDAHIAGIFDISCNVSGCHDGTTLSPLTYATMDSTRRELAASRVAAQTMPPAGNLSTAYMDSIRCWKDNGFLQN